MKTTIAFLLGICLLITAPVTAQDKSKKKAMASQEEMMKQWQEAMTPGEAHKVLEPFVGSWETESKTWMGGPDKPPAVSKGTAEVKWVLGGRFLQQEMTGEMMGMPMSGVGFSGYDNFKKKYNSFWIDNTATAMFTSEGTLSKDGKVLIYYGKMDEPMTGEKDKKVKFVDTIINHDKHIFEIHDLALRSPNQKVVEIVYERKK